MQVIMEENGNVSNKMLDLNINSGLLIYSICYSKAVYYQTVDKEMNRKQLVSSQ